MRTIGRSPILSRMHLLLLGLGALSNCGCAGFVQQTSASSTSTSNIALSTTSLPQGTVGVSYSASLIASGGVAPYQWNVKSGGLPAGIALNAAGLLSGKPSMAGASKFTVQVQDAMHHAASGPLSINITGSSNNSGGSGSGSGTGGGTGSAGNTLQVTTSSLVSGAVNKSYSAALAATGGTAPYQWSISNGGLPTGVSLAASSGAMTGTPSIAGTFQFKATVQDSAQHSATASLSILVASNAQPGSQFSISTNSLPSGSVGSGYSTTLTSTGGTAPYQWMITNGSLPAGLTLGAATGVISGTPTTVGNASISIEARDASVPQDTATKNFSLQISSSGPPPGAVVVTSFGATGNGQSDDTTAINNAIASLVAGQTLYFPCGTYLVRAALTPISLNGVQVLGPPSGCVTIHVQSANSFHAFAIQGAISSSVNLAANVTSDSFTLVSGGVVTLGLNVGDYVMISDTAINDNGPGSPPIATQEVVQVVAISNETVTIDGTFAWMFTLVSAQPAQWGGKPFAQKLKPVSDVVVKYIAFDGTGSTGSIKPFRIDDAVNSEVGFVGISNFIGNATGVYAFNPDTGYKNNFHDLTLVNAANGPLTSEGEAVLLQRQAYVTVNNVNVTASAGQGVFGFGCHDCYWSTLSNITVDLHGATGRVFKTLRADHNIFNNIVAMNGVGHNGINITDVSQYNTFNNCISTGNDQHGIDMFGSYDVGNTFNNCVSKYNGHNQFNFSSGASGQYADDNTTINGGTFCCSRGGGALIQQNGTGFTLIGAAVNDDQHEASTGLAIDGTNCTVTGNTFSGLPAGQDINVKSGTGCTFSGNSVPDGTLPSGLAHLFGAVKEFYAMLADRLSDNRR